MKSVAVFPKSEALKSAAAMSVKRIRRLRSSQRSSLISRKQSGHSSSKETSTRQSWLIAEMFMRHFNRINTSLRRNGPGVKGGS